jgi:hypothetical protein
LEEVLLVKEEMRRVIVTLEYRAKLWDARLTMRLTDISPGLSEGVRAYATKQARILRRRATFFTNLWAAPTVDSSDASSTSTKTSRQPPESFPSWMDMHDNDADDTDDD